MELFKKLFSRKSPQAAQPHSPLAERLSKMSYDSALTLSERRMNLQLSDRLAEPISILVLSTAHKTTEDLFALWRKNAGKKAILPQFCYDEVCIEFAAIAHYWLLRDYLNYEHTDYITTQEAYFSCLQDALFVSEKIFSLNKPHWTEHYFHKKALSYGMPTLMEKDAVLERLIVRAHAKQNKTMELPFLEMTANAAARQFFDHQLAGLEKTVSTFFQKSQNGLPQAV